MGIVHTIVVASRKGGSGKSMLSRHLAVEIERAAAGRVAMVDADPMRGLSIWWEARAADTPLLIDIAEGLAASVATARRMATDVLLIDTPPSIGDIVAEAVALADIVVIPVQPSPDDLRAVGSTVELAKRLRKRLVFVINQVKPRARLTGQAAIVLSQHGTVAPTMIADRTTYAASGTDGRTAPELDPAGDAAREIAGLWVYLNECAAEVAV
jgi:chromosome partitioning protein